MTVRMKADLDDKHRAGRTYDDFSPLMEARLVRSGLAERLSLDEARGRVGMEPLGEVGDEPEVPQEVAETVVGRLAKRGAHRSRKSAEAAS